MHDSGCACTHVAKHPADAISVSVKVLHCSQHGEEIGKTRCAVYVCLFASSEGANSGKKSAEKEKVGRVQKHSENCHK